MRLFPFFASLFGLLKRARLKLSSPVCPGVAAALWNPGRGLVVPSLTEGKELLQCFVNWSPYVFATIGSEPDHALPLDGLPEDAAQRQIFRRVRRRRRTLRVPW